MGRRTKVYQVDTEGRDKGKRFLITEMPASQAESWAYRVILALMSTNAEMPENFEQTGMAGLAQLGLRGMAGLPWSVADPLLKEMFQCVEILPDVKQPMFSRPLEPAGGDGDYDIEEIATRIALRGEIFKLHVDFSTAAVQSLIGKGKAAAGRARATSTELRK